LYVRFRSFPFIPHPSNTHLAVIRQADPLILFFLVENIQDTVLVLKMKTRAAIKNWRGIFPIPFIFAI